MRVTLEDVHEAESGRRARTLVLATVCISVFLINVDNTILNVALPTAGAELEASITDLQWVVDGFALPFAALLIAAGAAADRFGHRLVLLCGLGVLGAFALVGAFATDVGLLIGARVAMGIGAAMIFPSTLAILTRVYLDPTDRAKAIGAWTAVAGLAVASGPLVGGLLLQHFWWGSVLLVNVPIAVLGFVGVVRWVPETRTEARRPADVVGMVLSTVALTAIVWAVIEGPRWGWTAPSTLGVAAAGLVAMAAFVIRERSTPEPMIDLGVFKSPRLSAGAGAILAAFFALIGFIFLASPYLQLVLDYGTLAAGACIVPASVGIGVGSGAAPALARRYGARTVIAAGLALMCVGFAVATRLETDSSLLRFLFSLALIGFGVGLTTAPATELIVAAVPPGMAGVGSAINDTSRELGAALGVAVLGSVAASTYRTGLDVGPALSDGVVQNARESLPYALEVAARLPTDQARTLTAAATSAYVDALAVISLIAAVTVALALVSVAMSAALDRRRTRTPRVDRVRTPDVVRVRTADDHAGTAGSARTADPRSDPVPPTSHHHSQSPSKEKS
ncbi:MFS transporter [Nocardioides korecus]